MSQTIASKPLASLALPESPAMRVAVQVTLVLLGTLVLTLAAKTKVVLGPVDLNLGTLAVLLIGATFGFRLGLATLLFYLAEGAAGLPVFQSTPEKGIGLAYMLGTTGGYLVGYVAAAALVGWAADRGWDRNPLRLFPVMLAGAAIILVLGYAWLSVLIGLESAWRFGVLPFVLPDLVKVALASCLVPAAWASIRAFQGRKA